jgi:MinD superfamily P-loop ATPase
VGGVFDYLMGETRVGEAMSPPLIRAAIRRMEQTLANGGDAVIDAPPGTTCSAMAAVRPADAVVLVTEPTPFGLHDLDLAWRAFSTFGRPTGVVINRAGGGGPDGDAAVEAWCAERNLPVLARLPFDRAVARAYARGVPADAVSAETHAAFVDLVGRVRGLAAEVCDVGV